MAASPRAVQHLAALTALALLGAPPAAADGEVQGADLGVLVRCISASGAAFYGAHWCPVCRKQKEYFEGYAYLLPYVECYDGDKSDGINARCKDEGIDRFPTWKFSDGSVKTGARTPLSLAADSGCLEP
jgi:large repetitive protein